MKPRHWIFLLLVPVARLAAADEPFDQAMAKAAGDYAERLRKAGAELVTARERVAREKAPLLKAQRSAEDRLLAAESSVVRYNTADRNANDDRSRLVKAATGLHKNTSYLNALAQDALKGYGDTLAPGEDQLVGEKVRRLQDAFALQANATNAVPAADVAEFLLAQIQQSLGGYSAPGRALLDQGSELKNGTFAFVGPQTFFRADSGEAGVAVRLRDNGGYPVSYGVPEWPADAARALFETGAGAAPADATGSKALQLKQTTGTVWEHIEKGGYVALAILGVGLVALVLIVLKTIDAARLKVDAPEAVHGVLARLAGHGRADAEASLNRLSGTTRELIATGLRHADEGRVALEEHLQAWLLKQRLHFEHRLPLLAVIATAAPLMGLLGTVVGMVKTFALITVFGTGNAGKLASGISEVLVATELGLAVAIPTLVVHGFLSQRIQRKLAALERYALEFVTAATADREETVSR